VDGLLLTRRERLRSLGEKTGLVAGPSLVFALVVLALGLWVDAVFVTAVAGVTALALGSMARTRLGAAIGGCLLLGGLFVFLLFAAWMVSHPILPNS
jgi:hypothetical protein